MTEKTRKKNTRQRGSHTHGGGSKKKRRGAGHRGGRGNAGSGKRADQNKPKYWKDTKYFSGPPFKSKQVKPAFISISDIEIRFDRLLADGIITEKSGAYHVEFDMPCKLLSTGKPTRKYTISILAASQKAQDKIKAAGGVVELPKAKPEPKPAKEPVESKEATVPKEKKTDAPKKEAPKKSEKPVAAPKK